MQECGYHAVRFSSQALSPNIPYLVSHCTRVPENRIAGRLPARSELHHSDGTPNTTIPYGLGGTVQNRQLMDSEGGNFRGEAVVVDEVLIDGDGIAPTTDGLCNELAIQLAGARARRPRRRGVGGLRRGNGRGWSRVVRESASSNGAGTTAKSGLIRVSAI